MKSLQRLFGGYTRLQQEDGQHGTNPPNMPDSLGGRRITPLDARSLYSLQDRPTCLPQNATHATQLSNDLQVVYHPDTGAIAIFHQENHYHLLQRALNTPIAAVLPMTETSFLALYQQGSIVTWQLSSTWQPIRTSIEPVPSAAIDCAARLPNGKLMVALNNHQLVLYQQYDNTWKNPVVITAHLKSPVLQIQAVSDDKFLSAHQDHSLCIWEQASNNE